MQNKQPKICDSCLERGINPPNEAFRQYQENRWYCDECYKAEIDKLTSIPDDLLRGALSKIDFEHGPILTQIYELLNIPPELQYESSDSVCHHRTELFNHHAPSNLNLTLEQAQLKLEQMTIAMFQFQIVTEPLQEYIKKLKEKVRIERGLTSYADSKEVFTKVKKKIIHDPEEKEKAEKRIKNKVANISGVDLGSMDELIKLAQEKEKKLRERKWWIMSGNCPECGGKFPCVEHPDAKLI
jgi:hypothetical protein